MLKSLHMSSHNGMLQLQAMLKETLLRQILVLHSAMGPDMDVKQLLIKLLEAQHVNNLILQDILLIKYQLAKRKLERWVVHNT